MLNAEATDVIHRMNEGDLREEELKNVMFNAIGSFEYDCLSESENVAESDLNFIDNKLNYFLPENNLITVIQKLIFVTY
jgi:hypothetical protein